MKTLAFLAAALFFGIQTASAGEAPQLIIDPQGHTGLINSVLFTPDGGTLISLSSDKTIRVWDVETGDLRRTFRGDVGGGLAGVCYAGAVSPDGRWLAVGGSFGTKPIAETVEDLEVIGTIRIIDLDRGEISTLLKSHTGTVTCLAFSSDGSQLVSGCAAGKAGEPGELRVWDVGGLVSAAEKTAVIRKSQSLKGHGSHVFAAAFSPDGTRIVSGGADGLAILWALEDGSFELKEKLEGHEGTVFSVSYAPDGKHIVTLGQGGQIALWVGESGEFIDSFKEEREGIDTDGLIFSSDGRHVITSGNLVADETESRATCYAFPSFEEISHSPKLTNAVSAMVWHPTKDLVACAGGNNYKIVLWKPTGADAGAELLRVGGAGRSVYAAAYATDKVDSGGEMVAFGQTGDGEGYVDRGPLEGVFDFWEMSLIRPGDDVDMAGFFRRTVEEMGGEKFKVEDPTTLLIGSGGKVEMNPNIDGVVRSFSFVPGGDMVVGADYHFGHLRKGADGWELVRLLEGHEGIVWAASPSPDGRYLVSGSGDQTVRLWNLETGKLLVSLFVSKDDEWVCWTPGGHYHASPGGEKFIGWQINQGEDKLAQFFPAHVFRDQFHNSAVVIYTVVAGSYEKGLEEGGAERVVVEKVLPPTVGWVSPEATRGEAEVGTSVLVQADVFSEGSELEEVKLLLNGKTVAADYQASGEKMEFETEVELVPGENRLAVFARNGHSGQTSTERVIMAKVKGAGDTEAAPVVPSTGVEAVELDDVLKPDLYVLSVGVSDYENADLDLEFCDDDAEAIAGVFEAQKGKLFRNVEVKLLTNEKATRDAVLEGLDWLETNATQKDVVVLFLAAHGTNDARGNYYLMPTGGDFKKLRSTGVAWDDFADVLGNLPSRTLMFLDTCHSGQLGAKLFTFATRGNGDKSMDASEAIRELTSEENGVVIMSASTGTEESAEDAAWGHGAFTRAILDGISQKRADMNKDGIVHLRELDYFVSDRVKELTEGFQHPTTVKPSTISRLPLAVVGK